MKEALDKIAVTLLLMALAVMVGVAVWSMLQDRLSGRLTTVHQTCPRLPSVFVPPPSVMSAYVLGDILTVSWNEVPGATRYYRLYRTDEFEGKWSYRQTTHASTLIKLSQRPWCDSTHEFQVFAGGDGVTYLDRWGESSPMFSCTFEGCVLKECVTLPPEYCGFNYYR